MTTYEKLPDIVRDINSDNSTPNVDKWVTLSKKRSGGKDTFIDVLFTDLHHPNWGVSAWYRNAKGWEPESKLPSSPSKEGNFEMLVNNFKKRGYKVVDIGDRLYPPEPEEPFQHTIKATCLTEDDDEEDVWQF